MEFNKVLTVQTEIGKKEFLRKLMIRLSEITDTPTDIATAEFGEVQESTKEILRCSAHSEIDYTATVGYDRKEEYWDKEKYTENGITKYRDVKKTRTVTDWKPFSGHIAGDSTAFAFNGEDERSAQSDLFGDKTDELLRKILGSIDAEHVEERGQAEVSPDGLRKARSCCEYDVRFGIKFPGDRHKDESYHPETAIKQLICYILPFYEVDFVFRGKTYHASGFACGDPDIRTEYPVDSVDVKTLAVQTTKRSKQLMLGGWIGFAVLFVFACIMCAVKIYWTWLFPLFALGGAVALHVLYERSFNKKLRGLKADNVAAKRDALEESLRVHGYEALDEEELKLFDVATVSEQYTKSNRKKGFVLPTVLCSIAMAILMVVSCSMWSTAAKAALHSPEQFTVNLSKMSHEYKDSDSPYSDGTYYIYFEYTITAKEIGATSMNITTYITDKSGKSIGSVKSTLNEMNLSKKVVKTYTVSLENRALKTGDFFTVLYKSDYDDLVFEHEITSIRFDDGQSYYGN